MRGMKSRMVTVGIAALVLASSLGVIGAAPASARDDYAPQLAAITAAPKFAAATATNEALTTPAEKRIAEVSSPALAKTASPVRRVGGEKARASMLLKSYIAKYPILAGTTVSIGDARGYQAISYYQSGRIVISASHSASLERIMAHEIWHIIDWRDNGRIDWGENVPPRQ